MNSVPPVAAARHRPARAEPKRTLQRAGPALRRPSQRYSRPDQLGWVQTNLEPRTEPVPSATNLVTADMGPRQDATYAGWSVVS
jgi:hypothetical protein